MEDCESRFASMSMRELKQEIGLEGRSWPGFHHHGTLCIATYGFLISERERSPHRDLFPAEGSKHLPFPLVTNPAVPPIRPQRHVPNSIATLPTFTCRSMARPRLDQHRRGVVWNSPRSLC
jgi:hypothetical protein